MLPRLRTMMPPEELLDNLFRMFRYSEVVNLRDSAFPLHERLGLGFVA
jgi:hypothetical protein